MLLFLCFLLFLATSTEAGVIRHDSSSGSSAYSHQSITHIRGEIQPRILSTSSASTDSLRKIVFPSAKEDEKFHMTNGDSRRDLSSSEDSFITYKDQTPILNSHSHTPAHLAYSARPVVFKMLPMIVPAPYISYKNYRASHRS
ncbi:uncharacterized protein LOC142233902 [Haematobia irritans]|uniref:uncharacterized protein LOC142233902 n=1 Tax=Haematobia irritans TaxID=7368 RepID=UPI003F506636